MVDPTRSPDRSPDHFNVSPAISPAISPLLATPSPRPTHGGNRVWAATIAQCQPDELLDFSASINPLGPPASAIAAIQAAIADLCHYPDPQYDELRSAIAQHHNLDPAWIFPGNGAAELLTWLGLEFAQCCAVYLPTPAFADYRRSLATFGATVIELPLQAAAGFVPEFHPEFCPEFRFDQRLLPENIPDNAGLLLNTPHNPTGLVFPAADLRAALDRFALVAVDEAFFDFLEADPQNPYPSAIPWVADYPNLIVIRSLTKFYSLPGLRLGYAIAHPDRLQRWRTWRDPWSVNTLAAATAIAALRDREFTAQTHTWLSHAKPQLFTDLQALPGFEPLFGAANYLLIRTAIPSNYLQTNLLRTARLLIRDCLSFPELGDRYFRIAVRTFSENQKLLQALNASVENKSG